MTIAGASEDLAAATASAIRVEDPGSTGTSKLTTTVLELLEEASTRETTEPSKKHERATAKTARSRGRRAEWG